MAALRVLKLGDELYSESLQHIAPVYRRAFPQRETQLYGRFQNVEITRLTHQRLLGGETRAGVTEQVAATLAAGRFDLVLIDNPLSVLVLDHRISTPIVFDCIDWYEEMYAVEFEDAAGAALIHSACQECASHCTAVVAQSPLMLQAVWALHRPRHSLVIPNGYDETLFRAFSPDEVRAARSFIEETHCVSLQGRRVIVYTGKLGEWYRGLLNVIEGMDPSRDLLLVVGDGPLLARLPRRDHVVLCGAVPLSQVPLYSRAADVLAFPLGVDCSPIVLSEYLAVGQPIVAPRGRIEWLVRDGVNGAVVEDTPKGWREGIERAFLLGESARAANLKLSRRLGWSYLAARMETFLYRVASQELRASA